MDFLVVDDDKTFRDATCFLIDGEDHYAEGVASGEQAIATLKEEKFDAVLAKLGDALEVHRPDASFYLWPRTPEDDETFARELFRRENVLVLPGSYLSRTIDGINPGANRVRMALVASVEECIEAAERIRRYVESL